MIKENITINDALEVLNRALKEDHEAIRNLCINRTVCNKELGKDETIQVHFDKEENSYSVGLIGILNGLFGIDDESGFGAIAGCYEYVCNLCGYNGDGVKFGKKCPKCDGKIGAGKLQKFVRTEQSITK